MYMYVGINLRNVSFTKMSELLRAYMYQQELFRILGLTGFSKASKRVSAGTNSKRVSAGTNHPNKYAVT